MATLVGAGLAAACGFRVFVPLLVVAVAKRADLGILPSAGFNWLDSDVALVVLAAATALEIGAYYVPWVDNLLDTIATPAAGVAGTAAMMGMTGAAGLDPALQWGLGLIGGGGSAVAVQGLTVVTRAASTLSTGGLGNPVVATGENVGSAALATAAVITGPVVFVAVVAVVFFLALRVLRKATGRSDALRVEGDASPADLSGPAAEPGLTASLSGGSLSHGSTGEIGSGSAHAPNSAPVAVPRKPASAFLRSKRGRRGRGWQR